MPTHDYLTRLKEFNLTKNFLLAFLTQGFGALFLLFSEIYIARVIGVKDFGLYSLLMAWVYVLSLLGTLGLNQCILRFMPVYISQGNWSLAKGLTIQSLLWSCVFSCLLALVGFYFFYDSHSSIHQIIIIACAFLIIPINAMSLIQQAMVRTFGLIQTALTPEYLIKPICLIIFIFIASKLTNQVTLNEAILISILAATLGLTFITTKRFQYTPQPIKNSEISYENKQWLRVSFPLLLIVGFNLISGRIGTIMLGLLSTPESVALYSAASKISDAVIFGLVTANSVIVPIISKLHVENKSQQLQKTINKASKYILLITLPVAALILFFGKSLLLLFGDQYISSYTSLFILVVGQIANALSGPVAYILTMTGNHIVTAKVVAFSALLNAILSYILIPYFDDIGASIATSIGIILWNVLMINICIKKLGLRTYYTPLSSRK